MEKPRQSIEFSPNRPSSSTSRIARLGAKSNKGKNKRAFDLSIGADDCGDEDINGMNGANTSNGMIYDNDDMITDQLMEDSVLNSGGPDNYNGENQLQNYETEANETVEPQAGTGAKETKRRDRKPNATTSADDSQILLSAPDSERARRRPKKPRTEIYQDPDQNQPTAQSKKTDTNRMPPPKLRDPNTKIKIPRKTSVKPPPSRSGSRTGSVGPRSAFFQRSETPATDSGATITRSGRQSIKPLQSWLGEKVVMSEYTHDSLPAIKEVVRMQEVSEPPRRRQLAYRRNKRRTRTQLEDVEEEDEEEEERAPWELNPGIMVANVMDWDPNANRYDEDNAREEGKPRDAR